MARKLKFSEHKKETNLVRLDLGAGKGASTPEGFTPVDLHKWKGVKRVDLRKRWPWKANSVDEVRAAYLIHYLTAAERTHFVNELFRVLKSGATAQILTPHWCANRAYADINVQWPPVAEGWFHTLSKAWRDAQNCVDTSGMTCDFEATLGYGMHPLIVTRANEYQQHAVSFSKEAAQDIIATLSKP